MKKIVKIAFILFLILIRTNGFAQDPSNPGTDPGQVAPINDFIIPMLFVVMVIGYQVLIKQGKKVRNN